MLVDRDGEDAGVAVEGLLGAVAVVDVPVDDGHTPEASRRARMLDRHHDVGEDAEAAAPVESGLHGEPLILRILDEGVLQAIERFGQGSLAARGGAQFVSHR